jgi:sugar lactone lactonase YvrE
MRVVAVALSYLCALGGLLPVVAAAPRAGARGRAANVSTPVAVSQAAESHSVRQLLLPAKDLAVDPATQTIFASLPSSAGASGNSLAPIDPLAGTVGTPLFVGSEPGKLAVSDDGQFIYVALDGAAAVRRFDVATRTAGLQFSLGFDSFSGPLSAQNLAVQPGNPGTVAIYRGTSSSSGAAVALYDDGVQRGNNVVGSFSTLSLAFDTADPTRLYGLNFSNTLNRMTVTPTGLSSSGTSNVTATGAVKFDAGRLYSANGRVLDPQTGALLGTFTGENIHTFTAFVPDSKVGRAFFVTVPNSGFETVSTAVLRVFDQQTFTPTGTLDIPGVRGTPTALVRWGTNGLAFCTTSGQVFLIQSTLVSSAEPVATPSPTPELTPTPTPTPHVEPAFARQLALTANDIVYDPGTERIYASVPARAGAGGNSLTPVDPVAGTVGTPLFVGSEPRKLARSDDGQFIYVALDGAAAVRRVDVATQTAGLQFALGNEQFGGGPLFVEDMEVAPGNPHLVAVSRRNIGFSPKHEGVAVYDDGVRRAATTPGHTGSNVIEFSNSAATLYGFNNETTEFGFRKMSVNAAGVTVTKTTSNVVSFFGNSFEHEGGRAYFNGGRVIDAETAAPVGTFPVGGTPFGGVAQFVIPDAAAGRVYFLFGGGGSNATIEIHAFDMNTFLPVGKAGVAGANGAVLSFVRWGANGFAFSTSGGQLFLIQTSLIPSDAPAPVPTPTPGATSTPTPTPAPTPAPGQLRQLALATNDLAVDPVTQTIFASVPSSAGAGGNSIATIDPVAGTTTGAVFVGSEPNRLAVSDDGQFVYVGLNGAAAVRRYDVATKTAGPQFTLGSNTFGETFLARDLAAVPGQPNSVAVVRRSNNSSDSSVAVYDNGVQRPTASNSGNQVSAIEFSASPSVLYGYNGDSTEFGFRRMAVASCGVVVVGNVQNLFSGFGSDFKVDNGVAYSSTGRALDPEALSLRGTFSLASPNSVFAGPFLVASDAKAGRVYYLGNDGGFVLRVFDNKTFLQVGELRLPSVTGTASSLVRWGADGLAFRTNGGQVYLLRHPLIGGTDPAFVAAPTPTPPTFTATGTVSAFAGDPSGVQINVTGAGTGSATTDANGNFTIRGLPTCGNFTLTPSKTNYVFSPASVTVTNINFPPSLNFSATLKTVGFPQPTLSVSEGAGRVIIFVTRNTGTDQPATVSYETSSDSASDRSDFNTTLGTLQFAANESSKVLSVLISDDTLVEGTETFKVTLKDPSGAALATNFSTVTISINDNDTAQAAVNPLEDARFFVARHYQDFLNRNAADDPTGFNFWTKQLTDCAVIADAQARGDCLEDHRINVSAAFFLSIEFQQTGYLVHRLYTASYPDTGARPKGLPRFTEFLRDTQSMQRGLVVGQGAWQQQLEANKQAFVLAFVQRPEFIAAQPETLSAGELVDRLFANAGVTPTDAERTSAVVAFGGGGTAGRAAALRSVAESASVSARQFNSGFVLMQYFGYLRRGPNELPDADFSGYQFWLDKLNQFGDFRNAEMVKAFLVSLEYQQRFGPTNFDIRK